MYFFVALSLGAINSLRGGKVKGGTKPCPECAAPVGPGWLARAHFGPIRPRFLPGCFLRDSLFVCTCMWSFDIISFTVKA
jgi:hypothetical protein